MAGLRGLPASRTEPDGSAVVRLLSYNIRSLRDDREALVRVVRACAPDIVCVQEAPRFFRWRKKTNWLARDCGLVTVTGGATSAGTLLMASLRARVIRSEAVLLPRTPGLHQRGFATATLGFARTRLAVGSFHLSLSARERYDQAGALLHRMGGDGSPGAEGPGARGPDGGGPDGGGNGTGAETYEEYAVVAGDVNERPGGRTWQRLAGEPGEYREPGDGAAGEGPCGTGGLRELRDAHTAGPWGGTETSTSRDPRQRIDGIFVSPAVEVLGCGVPAGLPGVRAADLAAATDHLPVLAALRLRAPGPG